MKDAVVSDSTCLIGLERVGELDILPALFEPIMIPPEVEREFGVTFSWLKVENLTGNLLVVALQMVVDAGGHRNNRHPHSRQTKRHHQRNQTDFRRARSKRFFH